MLYETVARVEEILGLDADDPDLPSKRARVLSKAGTTDWVHWQTGAATREPRQERVTLDPAGTSEAGRALLVLCCAMRLSALSWSRCSRASMIATCRA